MVPFLGDIRSFSEAYTSGTTSQPKTHENLQISNATFGIFWEDWVNS